MQPFKGHMHYRKFCLNCKTIYDWCRCDGINQNSGSLKTIHGICPKCKASDTETAGKSQLLDDYSNPDTPLQTKEYICKIGNVMIYAVNEDEIHAKWTTDWCEGGSWKVYKFQPTNEIWYAITLNDEKIKHTVMHEFVESAVFDQFGNYNDAHNTAVKLDDFMYGNAGAVDGGAATLIQPDITR